MNPRVAKVTLAALLAGILSQPLMGCEEEKGPLEKAGEQADEAISDTKRAIEDASD